MWFCCHETWPCSENILKIKWKYSFIRSLWFLALWVGLCDLQASTSWKAPGPSCLIHLALPPGHHAPNQPMWMLCRLVTYTSQPPFLDLGRLWFWTTWACLLKCQKHFQQLVELLRDDNCRLSGHDSALCVSMTFAGQGKGGRHHLQQTCIASWCLLLGRGAGGGTLRWPPSMALRRFEWAKRPPSESLPWLPTFTCIYDSH